MEWKSFTEEVGNFKKEASMFKETKPTPQVLLRSYIGRRGKDYVLERGKLFLEMNVLIR